jgi:hypothetical protein
MKGIKSDQQVIAGHGQPIPSQPTTGPVGNGLGVPVVSLCEQVERSDPTIKCCGS